MLEGSNVAPKTSAVLFDIQRFSLQDGPGIRTTVFIKGCPLRCLFCQNPESQDVRPEVAFFAERCQGFQDCAPACPRGAIIPGDERVDRARCVPCHECAAACPAGALRLIGQEWTVEHLVEEALRDQDHFRDSGGGVTLSGGEPMLQWPFLLELLPHLRAHHVHVLLETCGHFGWEAMERVLPLLDAIYFDLKHLDPALHRDLTGKDNRLILDNFAALARRPVELQARMPVIPGRNDSRQNVLATAAFLRAHGKPSIHCLPYHNLGEAKLGRIGSPLEPLRLARPGPAELEAVRALFEQEGIHAVVYE